MRWISRPAATVCARCIYQGRNRFFASEAAKRPKSRFGPTVSLEHVCRPFSTPFASLYRGFNDRWLHCMLIEVVLTAGEGAESMETGFTRHKTDR